MVGKRAPGRAENDVNYSGDTALPEFALARAWQWTAGHREGSVLENRWLVSRASLVNIHVEALRKLGERTLNSSVPQSISSWVLCLSSPCSSRKWNQNCSWNLFGRRLSKEGKWHFPSHPAWTDSWDYWFNEHPSSPLTLRYIPSNFKEQVIIIIVTSGKMRLKMAHVKLAWYVPLPFSVVPMYRIYHQDGAEGGWFWQLSSRQGLEC